MTDGSDGLGRIGFLPHKYGRTLLVDARGIDGWTGVRPGCGAHALEFHEVLAVREGRARVLLDGIDILLRGPSLLVTRAAQARVVDTDVPLTLHLAVFTEEARQRARLLGGSSSLVPGLLSEDSAGRVAQIAALIEGMSAEITGGRSDADRMLDLQLAQLLILLGRASVEPLPLPRRPALLERLEDLVAIHFRTEHSARFYAGALGVTVDHLSSVVRAHGGGSVKDVIRRRIVLEAQRLLRHTTDNIANIAYALGYDDPAHFTRVFRHATGRPPSAFRETSETSG